MEKPVIFAGQSITMTQLARSLHPGCNTVAYLAVCSQFPKGATNKNFQDNFAMYLNPGIQAFWQVGGGPHQDYAMRARNVQGMGTFVERIGYPHKYRLTYLGLLLCARIFGVHQQIFHVDPMHPETDVVQRLHDMIDGHDDNPQQCLIVNLELDLTEEDFSQL